MIRLPPMLAKKPRKESQLRCAGHLAWLRKHACSVPNCDGTPIEAAHVRTGTDGSLSRKPSDRFAISLCAPCHKRQHAMGEGAFEREHKIDMRAIADMFWQRSPHRKRAEAKMRRAA